VVDKLSGLEAATDTSKGGATGGGPNMIGKERRMMGRIRRDLDERNPEVRHTILQVSTLP
jgi:hypothetical protein